MVYLGRISGITWSSDANNSRLTTRHSFEVYDSMVNVQSINVHQEHHIFDVESIFVWVCTRGARDSKLSTGNLQCCADACMRRNIKENILLDTTGRVTFKGNKATRVVDQRSSKKNDYQVCK